MITRTCRVSGKKFVITADDLEFYAKMGIISNEDYKKLKSREISDCVGLPTLCSEERQRRRLAWRNERKFYARKCDLCEKNIISIYDKNAEFPVYCQDCWWSDKWDAKNFSRDFDFSRPFFEQFAELQKVVPRLSLVNKNSENSLYTNHSANNKNCYLATVTFDSEDIYYSDFILEHCIDCVDCSYLFAGSELCYEVYYAWSSYNCLFSEFIRRCSDLWFCYDCINCRNCFMCSNLRNKEFCIKNKQYTKQEYEKIMSEILPMTYSKLEEFKKKSREFKKNSPHRSTYQINTESSTGNNLFNTKNCQNCFDSVEMEDCDFCTDITDMQDSKDVYHAGWSQLIYNSHAIANGFNVFFCNFSYDNKDIYYCDLVHNNHDLFGCVGLVHNKYCILNKQYTKEEYEKTSEKIIEHMKKTGEWGKFFSSNITPFAYNETIAQEYYPLTKEKAESLGYRWKEKISRDFRLATIDKIPDDIKDVDDSICREILACENDLIPRPLLEGEGAKKCGKNYQIQKPELRFYRKMNLPIPRECPDCRHADRMKLRNPRTLFKRSCSDCGKDIQTTFAPDRPEKVLCEECYLKVVE